MAAPDLPVPAPPPDAAAGEAAALARKVGDAYRRSMAYYRDELRRTFAEADAETRGLRDDDAFRAEMLERPAEEVSWWEVNRLAEQDPALATRRWESVKAAARDELASGGRAADALDQMGGPFQRAQVLALRAALVEEWRPRGGLELMLIDAMATAQAQYLYWLARLHRQAEGEALRDGPKGEQEGSWRPSRLSAAEAMEQSAAMCDRFNRLFLRTLRALRDLRRYAPAVVVQHAGQVNVGAQQVNVAADRGDEA